MTDGMASTPPSGAAADRLSRRDVIRRLATVGAATLWVAPAVQTIGAVPAFATGSPSPPPPEPSSPPPPPSGSFAGISYVALVFTCGGSVYRAKWEEDHHWGDVGGNVLPQCPPPDGWSTATVYPAPGDIGVSTSYIGGELYSVTFTLPGTCRIREGSGVAKGGSGGGSGTGDACVSGVTGSDPRIITFTAS